MRVVQYSIQQKKNIAGPIQDQTVPNKTELEHIGQTKPYRTIPDLTGPCII